LNTGAPQTLWRALWKNGKKRQYAGLTTFLSNATAIAEAMDVSVGHVSKLAKRAVGAGWLKVQGRKYILVSGVPV
jgi:CRP-like cAMP-binding protein